MPTNRAKICREMDVEAVRKRDLRAGRVCEEAEPRGGHHHELHPARNTGRPLRCNRTRMLRDYEHLPYSHDAVKYAACSNHYDAVQWAFERQQKQWSQEMIGNNFSRLVYCPGPSETSAFIAMLSGLCNEADVKQALIIALSNACSSHAKVVISGRHGKTPDFSEVFRTHASDLVERKVLRSEDGLLRLGEDESSTMLLTLGEICHGCDVYLAFKASVEHSLVDCIEALIHRVPVEYAVNALRDLLRNGRLNREDLRAVLVQHSAGDKEQELQVFRVLLLRGLHNDAERMARTMADRQMGGTIKETMGCTLRDEGTILAGRCDGHYKVFGDLDDVLVELIQSGEHSEMAMALSVPAMERIVERVEPHHIRSVFETAITRTKTLWVVDHVLAHVEIPEWEVLRFVEVLIDDRGSEYWKDAIHRLCNRPLGSSSTHALKKLAKHGLMDEAKVLIRVNLDDENKWWLATRSLAMLRVAFSGYIDELREEVVLLAGKSLPDYVDEVLDVA